MNDSEILPKYWCNLLYDYSDLHGSNQFIMSTVKQADKSHVFPKQPLSLLKQSHNLVDPDILIPESIRECYLQYRPTPFRRALQLEKKLLTSVEIYYKYEGANLSGSHKLNTALAQAYYFKRAGVKHLITGTGAGQWGTAIAYACKQFNLKCTIFMVDISLRQKPQRKALMEMFGATVYESPSIQTALGLKKLTETPNESGTLAIATGEAIELTRKVDNAQFAVGSGENSVLLHQTIIGNEVLKQIENLNIFPDKVYACIGAGSNFCGISFPLMRYAKEHSIHCEFIGVEPVACPKLTRGIYAVDINDFSGSTPYSKMYTLGSDFVAPAIHAGGLRYHGTSEFLSALYSNGHLKAQAISESLSLSMGLLFAEQEGILPAPESAYAIAAAVDDIINKRITSGKILINISGHGLFDIKAYESFQQNHLNCDKPDDLLIEKCLKNLSHSKWNEGVKVSVNS